MDQKKRSLRQERGSVEERAKENEASVLMGLENLKSGNVAALSQTGAAVEAIVLPLDSDLSHENVWAAMGQQDADGIVYLVWMSVDWDLNSYPVQWIETAQLDFQLSVYKRASGNLVEVHKAEVTRREPGRNKGLTLDDAVSVAESVVESLEDAKLLPPCGDG